MRPEVEEDDVELIVADELVRPPEVCPEDSLVLALTEVAVVVLVWDVDTVPVL